VLAELLFRVGFGMTGSSGVYVFMGLGLFLHFTITVIQLYLVYTGRLVAQGLTLYHSGRLAGGLVALERRVDE
jgi:hypothetical protein